MLNSLLQWSLVTHHKAICKAISYLLRWETIWVLQPKNAKIARPTTMTKACPSQLILIMKRPRQEDLVLITLKLDFLVTIKSVLQDQMRLISVLILSFSWQWLIYKLIIHSLMACSGLHQSMRRRHPLTSKSCMNKGRSTLYRPLFGWIRKISSP